MPVARVCLPRTRWWPTAANWPSFLKTHSTSWMSFCRRIGVMATPSMSWATPTPERYAKAMEIAAQDPTSDGMLVILTPQAMTNPTQIAEHAETPRPIVRQAAAGELDGRNRALPPARKSSTRAGIPTFPYPDTAARAFTYMWRYTYNLRSIYETPNAGRRPRTGNSPRAAAAQIISGARSSGRCCSTSSSPSSCLALRHPDSGDPASRAAEDEAVQHADADRLPVVLKLLSETITHKTDVGGVKLNLPD